MPDAPRDPAPAWAELSTGVWMTTVEPDTVNVGLVAGSRGCLLVDCGSSPEQGAALAAAATAVTDRPLLAVVLTHGHLDHVGGLAGLDGLGSGPVESIGHESLTTGSVTLSRPIALATVVDLGDRRVEIAHLGAGHTPGDLLIVVPDADLVFAGDLVESAGPPWFGADSSPAEWPASLDGLIGLLGEHSTVVPGHGPVMRREDVFGQRSELAAVSGELRALAETGVPLSEAAARGHWPYPVAHIVQGLAAGYAEVLPSGAVSGRRLPLV
ncbi:MAG: MBL fold metallo-hydrolase [Propionibacteriaceae bacterium]